jgi:transcriptional regulator NrdR family protein
MRLNKNFANVYTPFHEMEDFVQDLQQRKRHRKERRELTKPVEWD